MGGGAWPFLVGGVICLVNSVNERDTRTRTRNTNRFGETPHGTVGIGTARKSNQDSVVRCCVLLLGLAVLYAKYCTVRYRSMPSDAVPQYPYGDVSILSATIFSEI